MTDSIHSILKTVFGYSGFLPLQEEIIENILKKKDTLVIMPTGGGKSLCYQIPALVFPGLTVVVSPLISLMKDQVEQLAGQGVKAAVLNSSLSMEEYQDNVEKIFSGEARLLYIAPESLLTSRLNAMLAEIEISCLAIDEAHCISEWGHDFRPEYRQLIEFRKRFPEAVCVALTATATPRVRQDIKSTLGFESSNEFIASFNRKNLYLEVQPKTAPEEQLLDFLRRFPAQPGIIYCFSRRQVDETAAFLSEKGFSVRPYHAGLENEDRKRNQELFIRDDVQIIVATIAFGMGINKSNVRFVVHYDLPKSIEGYYQEIGRSGRDGLPAHCLLLFSYGDRIKQEHFIRQKQEPERTVAMQHLDAMVRYAESRACRRIPLLSHFGEHYAQPNCGMCDRCREPEENKLDVTTPALKFLSCVKRTGEHFGAVHVTDVLMGSQNKKVVQFGHQELSTFGIGKDLTREQWLEMSRLLVQEGYLDQDIEFRTLKLTPKAYQFFKTREPVMGSLGASKREISGRTGRDVGEIDYNRDLFEILRERRKQLANEAGVPPYVIFSDKTLVEMAAYLPVTIERMKKIYGIGAAKLERYGQEFADIIANYCEMHHLKPPESIARQARREPARSEGALRHMQAGELFNKGESVESIAEQFGVTLNTITGYLARCLLEGVKLRAGNDLLDMVKVDAPLQQQALKAFEDLGTQFLAPVFQSLNGVVDYDDLKLLRLHYIILQRQG